MRDNVPKVLILTGSLLCVTGRIRKPRGLVASRDPVSTHISVWPFSHSEVYLVCVRNSTVRYEPAPCDALGQERLKESKFRRIIRGSDHATIPPPNPPQQLVDPQQSLGAEGRSWEGVRQPDLAPAFHLPGMQNVSQGNSSSNRKTREGNQKSFLTHFSQWE